MSWDAYLEDDRGHEEGSWNYTHNTNRMIATAIEAMGGEEVEQCRGSLGPAIGPAWWDRLNGTSGPDGARLLDGIIREMESDPVRYEAMNPENGWGAYDTLLKVLREMRSAVPEWPTKWSVHG